MKKRILSQVVAPCALGMGLFAQDEPAPGTPAPGETPAPAPAETPAPAPEETPAPAETPAPTETPAETTPPPTPAPTPPAGTTTPPVPVPPVPPAPPAPPKPESQPAPSDVAAPPADAEKTESGLASKVIQAGTGTIKPSATDRVKVHYSGWQTDGYNFDSSLTRGTPATFPLNGVIAGWTEGVQLMVEGEKRRFWIPGELAYGVLEGDLPPIEGFGTTLVLPIGPDGKRPGRPLGQLCFDIELIKILRPHETPKNLTAAPEDATVNPSGMASKVVKEGTGTTKPKATDNVRVHYTVWTTDGTLVDSTLPTESPKVLPLKRTVLGFTEAVQMMVEGETRRIWVPQNLAYGEDPPPTAPKGMLVFEVELLKIFPN